MPARKTRQELELSGTLKRNPARYANRGHEPQDGRPFDVAAPADLAPEEVKVWNEVLDQLPEGLLFPADRQALVTLTKLIRRMRADTLTATQSAMLLSLLGKFGMTPADRVRVSVRQRGPQNKFQALASEIKRVQ